MVKQEEFDAVVIGAGNAGLTAALAAQEAGAKVAVLEKAPIEERGGDTYYTGGGFRFAYRDLNDVLELIPDLSEEEIKRISVIPYPEDIYYNDMMRVTHNRADPRLLETVVNQSRPIMKWMMTQGVNWELMTETALRLEGNVCWPEGASVVQGKGGGTGLSDGLFDLIEKRGIQLYYQTRATRLLLDTGGSICGVTVKDNEGFRDISARAVIIACGGFQANSEMRAKYLGRGWDTVKVRGTGFDTGDGIRMALEIGAQPYGQWSGCHATAIDADAPDVEERSSTDKSNRKCFWVGVMLNINGKRFTNEGEDFKQFTYAKTGRAILEQPEGIALQIFDSKVQHLLEDRYISGANIESDVLEELFEQAGIDRDEAIKSIEEFNKAVQPGTFDPRVLDNKGTVGVTPPKSNWSQKIDSPPFAGYPVTCGITFTFGGLRINERAQVLDTENQVIPGLYAAGEVVGGLFYDNYLGATGLTAGSVFGYLAGQQVAKKE
jgi:tricarballylate dehydrogenase